MKLKNLVCRYKATIGVDFARECFVILCWPGTRTDSFLLLLLFLLCFFSQDGGG